MTIKNDFPCKNCPKKGCGAYHDVCEAYQAFRQKRATSKTKTQRRDSSQITHFIGLGGW